MRAARHPRARSGSLLTALSAIAAALLFVFLLLFARALPVAWLDRWLWVAAWMAGVFAYGAVATLHARLLASLDERWRERFVVTSPRRRHLRAGADDEARASD